MAIPRLGCFGLSEDINAISISGFDFVELNLKEIVEMSSDEFDSFEKTFNHAKIDADVCSWILPIDLDLTDEKNHPETWKAYLETGAERSRRLGTTVWVIGSGKGRSIKPENGDPESQKRRVGRFFNLITEIAAKNNIQTALEPLGPAYSNYLNTLEECDRFIAESRIPGLYMICDFRHMISSDDDLDNIQKYQQRIIHAHIDYPYGKERLCPREDDRCNYKQYIRNVIEAGITRLSVEALHEADLSTLSESVSYLQKCCSYADRGAK